MKQGLIPESSTSPKRAHCNMDTEEDPTVDLNAIPKHYFPLGSFNLCNCVIFLPTPERFIFVIIKNVAHRHLFPTQKVLAYHLFFGYTL
ncbi:hypothetical protein NPIL_174611 [Nephila pilipes]|uniref:Uncharacterized protein n=1 Tax=Nephila pilipes TaxID=299642 RepID=A0A8X6TFZ5_NEPPI|nr:hypothetical protein NPIL_174611 [Nephila pilipes]